MKLQFSTTNKLTKKLRAALLSMCLIAFSYLAGKGQSIESISGTVINSRNEGLFGNALILSLKDSSIVKGISFLEGRFELANLNEESFLLKLTSLQFEDTYIHIAYKGVANINLGDIIVAESQTQLEEVVIHSKASLVRERADGSIEVTVENTTLATSSSVTEILSRSPSIVFDEENRISVFGKGSAILFINGIRVERERLSTLSPSDIASIEIISNPGPRYDAEGHAVINIITKGNSDEGSKGMIKNYYSYSPFAGGTNRTDINYNYSKGKWALSSTYGLLFGKDRHILRTSRSRKDSADFFNSDVVTDWQYENDNLSNYGLGVQYEPTKDSYASLQYSGAYEKLGGNLSSNNRITDEEAGLYKSLLSRDDQTLKNALNANYYAKIDSLGSNLFIGSQYAAYHNNFNNNIEESSVVNGIESNSSINNVGENNIHIFSIQSDYTKVFESNNILEFGVKYGYVNINSNTTFSHIVENGMLNRNDELSSSFQYEERVPAGYFNFKGLSDNINYSVGLRTELTDYKLFSSVNKGEILEDRYIDFFPNASLNAKLSDKLSVYLTYSSRINRPPYNRLNPFVIYQDAFTSIRGNRNLQPSRIHSLELGGAYRGWSLKTGYNYAVDPITGGAFQSENNPREYILQQVNVGKEHAYFATLSKNMNLPWWRSINTLSMSYDKVIDHTGVFNISGSQPYYYLYSQNSFDIQDWFTIYITGWYLTDQLDGIKLRKRKSTLNVGIEKKLLNDTFTFNLDFNDIFYKDRAYGRYRAGITEVIYANQANTNYVRVSVSCNFGKLKKLKYSNKDVGTSENKRIE